MFNNHNFNNHSIKYHFGLMLIRNKLLLSCSRVIFMEWFCNIYMKAVFTYFTEPKVYNTYAYILCVLTSPIILATSEPRLEANKLYKSLLSFFILLETIMTQRFKRDTKCCAYYIECLTTLSQLKYYNTDTIPSTLLMYILLLQMISNYDCIKQSRVMYILRSLFTLSGSTFAIIVTHVIFLIKKSLSHPYNCH